MDVGIRELKKNLSAYLERASQGELIRVTDRGRAKALLGPIPRSAREKGVEEGWIRPGLGRPAVPVQRVASPKRVHEVLAEDRDE